MDSSETVQARPRKRAELFKALVLLVFSVKFLMSAAPSLGTLVGWLALGLVVCAGVLVIVAIFHCFIA